ncbi:hypothetical protein PR048_002289 [Dryococelus australis]|uniref:Uncharacterized protein n=1 Tax=Dryococelus australis TaxID=614101 RepID=A0ABQ9IJT0_9NEOP|nr:hypothetical protein PR048_002289 [Dryococelus australis]
MVVQVDYFVTRLLHPRVQNVRDGPQQVLGFRVFLLEVIELVQADLKLEVNFFSRTSVGGASRGVMCSHSSSSFMLPWICNCQDRASGKSGGDTATTPSHHMLPSPPPGWPLEEGQDDSMLVAKQLSISPAICSHVVKCEFDPFSHHTEDVRRDRTSAVNLTASHEKDTASHPAADFHKWELCQTILMVSGFSRGSPVSSVFSFWSCSILTSLPPHWLSRPQC